MTSHSTIADEPQSERQAAVHLFDHWFDPIEASLRDCAREFLHAMLEAELDEVLDRSNEGHYGWNMTCGGGEVPGCSMDPKQHHIGRLGVGKNIPMIHVDPGVHATSRCCQDAGRYNTQTYVCRVGACIHMVYSRERFAG
jgi:hypothetical protein